MASVLIADIGGSNSRFALTEAGDQPRRVKIINNDEQASLDAAIASYLHAVGARPRAAVLAVAGPTGGEEITLTNRPDWRFTLGSLARRFGFKHVRALNDFEAVAHALPRLGSNDTRVLGPRALRTIGPRVVLGPGTGLGIAALIPLENGWEILSSEGGHASLGPREADEFPIFERLCREHGSISVETILSGNGLVRLAQVFDPKAPATPEALIAAALAGESSPLAAARLFVRILGRVAGDLALTFKASGGVYLAGGAGRGLKQLLDEPSFRAAFEAHPPYENLLAAIPTLLITYDEPGLLGCAVVAERLRI